MDSRFRPPGHLSASRKEESEMFYKNNIEYFIFPIFYETFYYTHRKFLHTHIIHIEYCGFPMD